MAQSLPTQRTLAELKKRGYVVAIVERWNSFAHIRQDLFGFIDILAFHPEKNEILGIQATADNGGGNLASRANKILGIKQEDNETLKQVDTRLSRRKRAYDWVSQPCRKLECWGWGQKGPRGTKKVWTLRVIPITLKEFSDSEDRCPGLSVDPLPAPAEPTMMI